jgi:hypothetical protein
MKKKRGRKARFPDADAINRELAAIQRRALNKPHKAYKPRIALDRDRVWSMVGALSAFQMGEPLSRDKAHEIELALRIVYDALQDDFMRSLRHPRRASHNDLIRARTVVDLLSFERGLDIQKDEALRAAFECSDVDLPNVRRNFDEMLPALALANPIVQTDFRLVFEARQRVIDARAREVQPRTRPAAKMLPDPQPLLSPSDRNREAYEAYRRAKFGS